MRSRANSLPAAAAASWYLARTAPFNTGAHLGQVRMLSHEGTVPRGRGSIRSRTASSQPGPDLGLSMNQLAPASR